MQGIIYKSDSVIPWDTQSAFKMTSYNCSCEENMIFCYLKQYVKGHDMIICVYCFRENPKGKNDIKLFINPNPEKSEKQLWLTFGFEGISSAFICEDDLSKKIDSGLVGFSAFKADDEQGFYWCGEITLSKEFLFDNFEGIVLKEKSLVCLNAIQTFENGDFFALSGDALQKNYLPYENMSTFVVLNY